MSWLTRTMLGLALAFGASAAFAGCPGPCGQDASYGGYQGGYVADGAGYDARGSRPGYAYDGAYVPGDGYYDNGGPRPGGGCNTCGGHGGGYQSYDGRGGYSLPTYGDVAQHYGSPSCGRCAALAHERAYQERYGELILSNAFTYDGGVGPYPEGGYSYGGGGGYAAGGGFAGAGTSAHASAYASSSSHVSVNIGGRGGHKGGGGCSSCGGGYKGGGGHK